MEKEQTDIIAALSSSEFYAGSDSAGLVSTDARLDALMLELDKAYSWWEELEELSG